MPNPTRPIGNQMNIERLSGRLFFRSEFNVGYRDLGDVIMHKFAPDNKIVEAKWHTRAATEKLARQDTQSSTMAWELTFQEHTIENEALILQGLPGSGFSQAAIPSAATQTLNAVVLDQWYDLGVLSLLTLTATVSAANKTTAPEEDSELQPSVDVLFDKAMGQVLFPSTGTVTAGANVTVTYTAAAVSMATVIEPGLHPIQRGQFRLAAFDGETVPVRSLLEFTGQLTRDDPGQFGVDKHNEFKFKLTAVDNLVVRLGV